MSTDQEMNVPNRYFGWWLWTIVAITVIVLALGVLVLVTGAFRDSERSLHGTIGSSLWTTVGPHLLLLCVIGVVVSVLGYRYGVKRVSSVAFALSTAAMLGSAFITFSIVSATSSAGGSASLLSGLWLKPMVGEGPDQQWVFSEVEGEALQVAIYNTESSVGDAPVLMYIHGGGFKVGSNVETDADLRWFAEQGWLVFSVDYRLWSNEVATWDLASVDIACAAAWVAANAARFGGDIERLVVLGDSAGGNLAINYAYAVAQDQLQSDCGDSLPAPEAVVVQYPAVDPIAIYEHGYPVPGFEPKMLVIGYLGGEPQDYPERVSAVSSYTYISEKAPPTLIISPEKDGLVPSWSVVHFADSAQAAGVAVELVKIPFANHVYNQIAFNSIGNQARLSITRRYLAEQGLLP
ncbi:MAG TPA: alpha/beta hydrolase [Marinagarivorans sp.]